MNFELTTIHPWQTTQSTSHTTTPLSYTPHWHQTTHKQIPVNRTTKRTPLKLSHWMPILSVLKLCMFMLFIDGLHWSRRRSSCSVARWLSLPIYSRRMGIPIRGLLIGLIKRMIHERLAYGHKCRTVSLQRSYLSKF